LNWLNFRKFECVCECLNIWNSKHTQRKGERVSMRPRLYKSCTGGMAQPSQTPLTQ
jgi:hypothetical protein